jgi:hypothetical protein
MFPCMIARAATIDIISSGMGGTRNGALQLVSSLFEFNLRVTHAYKHFSHHN